MPADGATAWDATLRRPRGYPFPRVEHPSIDEVVVYDLRGYGAAHSTCTAPTITGRAVREDDGGANGSRRLVTTSTVLSDR